MAASSATGSSATVTLARRPSSVKTFSIAALEWPAAWAVIVNGPPTRRPVATNWPLAVVVAVETVPVGTCSSVTCAPATGAPEASTTEPATWVAVSCALAIGATPTALTRPRPVAIAGAARIEDTATASRVEVRRVVIG